MSEEEVKYIFRNRKGKVIYKPVYEQYNEYFFENIIAETGIKAAFNTLADTSLFERFMLNAAQFSAAKSVATAKLIQAEIFDKGGKVRTFPEFKKKAEKITKISNETWLRVEYESARQQAVATDQYMRMYADRDLYPYWVYRGRMDSRERPDHVALEGKVFRIGSKYGDMIFHPADWNCRCTGEPVDDDYLKENNLRESSEAEAKDLMEKHVDQQFQRSPVAGTLPNTGSYFEAMKNANQGSTALFGLDNIQSDTHLEGLAAKGLHQLVEIVTDWRNEYPTNKAGDIIFQYKPTYTNVRFTSNSLHEIQKNARGFENIPDTVKSPDEVWSSWEDASEQLVTLRNYLKFGSISYVVQTRDGVVTNAFAVSNRGAQKFRKGVIL
jgi:hypothetical protein